LVRKTLPGAFTFEYTLPPTPPSINGTQQQQQQQQQHIFNNDYGVYGPPLSHPQPAPVPRDSDDPTAPSGPLPLNVENDLPSVLQFSVSESDIGGSLVVELGINSNRVRPLALEKQHDFYADHNIITN